MREAGQVQRKAIWQVLIVALCLLIPSPSDAEDVRLMSVGIRGGFTGASVLGEEQRENFQEYDVVAQVKLPWSWYAPSGWGVGTRFIGSVGALTGGGETGFIASLIPALALGSQDGRFALDVGVGGALLSRYHFGRQDFGGPFQIAATLGISVPLDERLGIGYRFQHYSDAPYTDHRVEARMFTCLSSPIDIECSEDR